MANTSEESTEMDRPPKPMYLDYLPEEILLKIFLGVPRCKFYLLAQVSPRFERICGDWRFWGKVTVREESISYYEFEQLISGPWVIRELDLTGVKIRSSKYNASIRTDLDKLNISRVSMDKTNWQYDSFWPVFLETALVTACRPKDQLIMNGGVLLNRDLANAIAESTELQVLSMELVRLNVYNSDNTSLRKMLESLRQLKQLNMRFGILNIDQWIEMCDGMPTTVEKLFLNHFGLQHRLTNQRYRGSIETIVDYLTKLLGRLANLRHLGLSCHYIVEPAVVEKLVRRGYLETLHFCTCDFVRPEIVVLSQVVVRRLSNLKRLHFSQCPLRPDLTVEIVLNDLENWSNTIPDKYTTISFTELECVIEFVSRHKRLKS